MSEDVAPVERHPVAAATRTVDLALVATGAALLAVCSLLSVRVGASGVPITLQTFAVLLIGAILGARRGALAVLLYLAVGFAGLPVFAEGSGGPATFAKPSVGYLVAFPLAAFVVGVVVQRAARSRWYAHAGWVAVAALLGTVVVYALGVPVLALRLSVSLAEAFGFNTVFLPFDAVKVGLVTVVAAAVHRAFPDLLRGR